MALLAPHLSLCWEWNLKLCACWTRALQLGSIPIHGKCVLIKWFNSQGLAANCPHW